MLKLSFFKRPFVILNAEPVTGFLSEKVIGLLAYLALNAGTHSREQLATLLWGDMPDDRAKANLRQALHNLQKKLPGYFDVSRKTAAFKHEGGEAYQIDVIQLEQATATADRFQIQTAVDQYQNDLLYGLGIQGAPEFEDWVRELRETLRLKLLDLLARQVELHEAATDHVATINTIRRLLHIEPWHEAMHQRLMLTLARDNQYTAAIAQYRLCRQTLKDELGIDPMPETTTLFRRIEALRRRSRHHLPVQATRFFGREHATRSLVEQLRAPDCRLLSIIGPGGMGKTRLALNIAEQIKQTYAEGAIFIPCVGVLPETNLLVYLATTLANHNVITASQGDEPIDQFLVEHLADKEMLIILDNVEHLLDPIEPLLYLLPRLPNIKLIATTRERINSPWERPYWLTGMAFDDGDHSESYQFFIEAAQRHRPGFTPTMQDARSINKICQKVEGLPLAIELAAAWLRTFSCQQIVAQIVGQLDTLTLRQRGGLARHSNIAAVIAQSWQLLNNKEKMVMQALSTFRDGFQQEAAEVVAQADLSTVAALVDKSLLRPVAAAEQQAGSRFDMHELIRQFAQTKLEGDEVYKSQSRENHALYYTRWLIELGPDLKNHNQTRSMQAISIDLANIRAAWQWGIDQNRLHTTADSSHPLSYYFLERSLYRDGYELFKTAIDSLPADYSNPLVARLALYMTRFMFTLRRIAQAKTVVEQIQPTLEQSPYIWENALAIRGLSLMSDNRTQVISGLHRSLALFRQTGDQYEVATELLNIVAWSHTTDKLHYLEEAADILESLGEKLELSRLFQFQASIQTDYLGRYEQAKRTLARSLELQTNRDTAWTKLIYIGIAFAEINLGNLLIAQDYLEKAHNLHQSIHPNSVDYSVQLHRLRIALILNDQSLKSALLEWIDSSAPSELSANEFIDTGYFHLYKCLALACVERVAESTQSYHRAIDLFEAGELELDIVRAHLTFGWIQLGQKNRAAAFTAFRRASETAVQARMQPMLYEAIFGIAAALADIDPERSRLLSGSIVNQPATADHIKKWAQANLADYKTVHINQLAGWEEMVTYVQTKLPTDYPTKET